MRIVLATVATLVVALLLDVRSSGAVRFGQYPWCLDAGGSDSQFTSCAFDTFEQCMQTGWGDGGVCYRNPAYRPLLERSGQKPRRKR
jgi:hypothetical protein